MGLTRSETMARVRSKDTTPEMRLRRALHSRGLRYRLHAHELPGKPDIVFRRQKVAIFVHGCFWHSHPGCSRARIPSSRQEYWIPKLDRNKARDSRVQAELRDMGWTVIVVWECRTKTPEPFVDEIAQAVSRREV